MLFEYERDDRCCPSNRRRGQFRAGWRRGQVSEQTLKERLTWHNLGYRMGQHFGSQAKERIDKVFQILAEEYQEKRDEAGRPLFPDEVEGGVSLREGAKRQVTVNAYERKPQARRQCIEKYGTRCCICDFSFGDKYGKDYQDFIHVHHRRPLAEIGEEYQVDPVEDLRPVCPNCHAVIHRRNPALSIEEVIALLLHGESR